MEAGPERHGVSAADQADQAVLLSDAARPCAIDAVPEAFGLSDPVGGVVKNVID